MFAKTASSFVRLVSAQDAEAAIQALPDAQRRLAARFTGKPGQIVLLPGDAEVAAWLGIGSGTDVFALGHAAKTLPAGDWSIANLPDGWDATLSATAWALGGYTFDRFKPAGIELARLCPPETTDTEDARRIAEGVMLSRDLINTPADRMGPEGLEAAARNLAERHGATVSVVTGDDLLAQNYPMIHAVGRAASEAPRLIELEWGNLDHPRIALVGKGVCFDSGGLDIKAAAYMRLMKKDMGGAANVLGLAHMIMSAGLNLRLHVLVPAVENAVGAGAFRPGDVLDSRQGLTVEIDNTDAEGRLVLGDALTKAGEHDPALVIDMATLTGAARVALGPEVMPFYTDDNELASDLAEAGTDTADPLWRMPLWEGYDRWMDGSISDLVNGADTPFAGSITAALFLRRFAPSSAPWVHFDIFGWNPKDRPGRPKGGESQASRAIYHMLKKRFLD